MTLDVQHILFQPVDRVHRHPHNPGERGFAEALLLPKLTDVCAENGEVFISLLGIACIAH